MTPTPYLSERHRSTYTAERPTDKVRHDTAKGTATNTAALAHDPYRCPKKVTALADQIRQSATRTWSIMEVCGGQTNSIVRYGLDQLLTPAVQFIHGPGCPVCVTPETIIAQAIAIARRPDTILCTFGDMLRVPTAETWGHNPNAPNNVANSPETLLMAKAQGAQVQPIYSPIEAVSIAEGNPSKTVVFLAVGFETTTPATALAAISAKTKGLTNFYMLVSHVRVPPALASLINTQEHHIDALLAAGHVCTVMGTHEYVPLVRQGRLPIIVTGFEPVDILYGVLAAITQLEDRRYALENQYPRYVSDSGNDAAQRIIHQVYQTRDQDWRGLGKIPDSGWQLKPEYQHLDATSLFTKKSLFKKDFQEMGQAPYSSSNNNTASPYTYPAGATCQAGGVLTGKLKPNQCPHFGTRCQPKHPLGAPMVSDEGACAAYFHHRGTRQIAATVEKKITPAIPTTTLP